MKHSLKKKMMLLGLGGIMLGSQLPVLAQENYVPTASNLEAREKFNDSRFGIFLHWGIYSMYAQGEWYMHNAGIDHDEYAKAASGFYPSKFNAHDWVAAIKAAGAKYICFTTRHHDSFSMFDTKYSDYDIMDATPFKRDVVKELADECAKQGITLHLYYSHLDWTREDYYPLGRTGHTTGRKNHGEWKTYQEFMNNQLTELLTNYGPIGAIWFDGKWDQPDDFDWHLDEQYALIHRLQPACLIGNNHHKQINPGEDFQMFERDLPGENKAGLSDESVISRLPLETCETMNGMWGYKIADPNYKSVKQLVRLLVGAAGKGANLLMNIGPQPNGELPALALDRLKGMGEWLNKYGETIYATDGAGIVEKWGTVTKKGNKLYVHILADEMPDEIVIPLEKRAKKVFTFDDHVSLKNKYDRKSHTLTISTVSLKASADCIVEVHL